MPSPARRPVKAPCLQRWVFISDKLLPIVVIAQNSLDVLITGITFVIYFVIADKLSR